MSANLQDPIFTDEARAREWLEARVWPNGPVCPHCGSTGDDVTKLAGKGPPSRRLPGTIHGHSQDGFRALENSALEMASHGLEEERFGASNPSLTRLSEVPHLVVFPMVVIAIWLPSTTS
jgi:Transposase zinc-ribbon domain